MVRCEVALPGWRSEPMALMLRDIRGEVDTEMGEDALHSGEAVVMSPPVEAK